MQALGLIETKGLLPAIESADAMLKAADVTLAERAFVGGGLVTITVIGDVAAVKAAVDAGAAAVNRIGKGLLLSTHVIPRPDTQLGAIIALESKQKQIVSIENEIQEVIHIEPEIQAVEQVEERQETEQIALITEEEQTLQKVETNALDKETVDALVFQSADEAGLTDALAMLEKLKVVALRNLARRYEHFGILGRAISEANKERLLVEFETYYKNQPRE